MPTDVPGPVLKLDARFWPPTLHHHWHQPASTLMQVDASDDEVWRVTTRNVIYKKICGQERRLDENLWKPEARVWERKWL